MGALRDSVHARMFFFELALKYEPFLTCPETNATFDYCFVFSFPKKMRRPRKMKYFHRP